MNSSFFEKSLIYIIILAVLVTFVFIFYLFFGQATKNIEIKSPNGGEEWAILSSYKISWKSRGVSRVGIVLFDGKEPKWIAKNVQAGLGEYEWKILPGQEYKDNYWIAVFEYPWQKDSKIDYSDGAFAIIFPELATCEKISVNSQWPYVPSDMPDLRRVFITENSYSGDLGGLNGADRICQKEAKDKGFSGDWIAFLGGDSDDETAVERLGKTPRGTDGIYIEAKPSATLIRGETCNRMLAKDFDNFLKIFSASSIINQQKLNKDFYNNIGDVWLGRIDKESKRSCLKVKDSSGLSDSESPDNYSLTTTCQNWSIGKKGIGDTGSSPPNCYTSAGKVIEARGLAGLSLEISDDIFIPFGNYCNTSQKIICIEK